MKKKSHGVQLIIRAVVRDPDGKIISDTGQKPSRSFVIQFLEFLYPLFNAPSERDATTVTNTEKKIYYAALAMSYLFTIDAGVNRDESGIVVGTGDTAEGNTDYALATQLGEGAGAGEISHGAMVMGTAAVVGANVDLVYKRAFTNNTGDAITVKEAGIITNANALETGAYHLILRDVLAASVEVPDKCSITMYYTLRTTV